MNIPFRNLLAMTICIGAIGGGSAALGVSYTVIYSVSGQDQQPLGIIEGAPGLFYFQAFSAAILDVTTQGTATTLASFPTHYIVESAPGASAANGLVYSSVEYLQGGYYVGSVFSVGSTAGSEIMYPPTGLIPQLAGNLPNGKMFGLVYDQANNIYLGMSDLKGTVSTFYQYPVNDRPGVPIFGTDGNFYGVSSNPTVSETSSYFYRVTRSGSFTKIATLPFIVTNFVGGGLVLQGTDGNFYGIQSTSLGCGSSNVHGGVYKLTLTGQYTLLHDFGVCANGVVDWLIEGSDGKLYGAVEGNSTLFSLTTSGAYKVGFEMNGANGLCPCSLLQGSDGNIYGTAQGGGSGGFGVIFSFNAELPVPKPRAQQFNPASGTVGTQVLIWGYNLFGATVQFNGTSATSVHSAGPNYVWATVPTGATTGPITITTPGGTVTTEASFTVK